MRWILQPEPDEAVVDSLVTATRQPRLVCRLLAQRGVADVEAARAYLAPKLEHLHDPFLMKGVDELVDRLLAARERGELIGIHGDYDVDGLTSTALYTRVLREQGFRVLPFVPHRMKDGYGVAVRAIEEFVSAGVGTILTCDTGFSAVSQVAKAVDEHGLQVLITDHHLPPEGELPRAHALVNPHQDGCSYPFKGLCGVGVAFKVLQALLRRSGVSEAEVLYPYLDLVALGTIADVVPLIGENRILARWGLRAVTQTKNVGLQAVFKVAGIDLSRVTERDLGWGIGPRFNAAGRIDDAAKGLELLLTDDPSRAEELARELDQLNESRRAMTRGIQQNATHRLNAMDLSDVYGIVLFGDDGTEPQWHHGVIGIVASKIVEAFGRPTVLMAWDEGMSKWKGSGRAPRVDTVHLKAALDQCADHLAAHGGHKRAAGATLKDTTKEAREAFARAFNEAVRAQMRPEDRIPALYADLETTLDQLNWDVYGMLERFAPFGEGNDPIQFVARNVEVLSVRVLGQENNHLKLTVRQNDATFDAIAFGFAELFPDLVSAGVGSRVDLIFRLDKNQYKNRDPVLQLRIQDLRVVELAPPREGIDTTTMHDVGGGNPNVAPITGSPEARYAPKRLFA